MREGGAVVTIRRSLFMATVAAGVMTAAAWYAESGVRFKSDLDQLWIGGRALLAGDNPYDVVRATGEYPLVYPLPAVTLILPLTLLPLEFARLLFAGLTAFIGGYGLARHGPWTALALLSPVWWAATIQGQVAPALAGAAMIPALGFLYAGKPTIALALWASRPTVSAVVGSLVVVLLSFLLMPSWIPAWLTDLPTTTAHFKAPVVRPGGFLLLLAFLRWRTPEGRLLGVWSLIPRTESLYDLLPLYLLTFSWTSAGLLTVTTFGTLVALGIWGPPRDASLEVRHAIAWPWMLAGCYMPALFLVFTRPATGRRPHCADPPSIEEQAAACPVAPAGPRLLLRLDQMPKGPGERDAER
jgi:hypothetical protein